MTSEPKGYDDLAIFKAILALPHKPDMFYVEIPVVNAVPALRDLPKIYSNLMLRHHLDKQAMGFYPTNWYFNWAVLEGVVVTLEAKKKESDAENRRSKGNHWVGIWTLIFTVGIFAGTAYLVWLAIVDHYGQRVADIQQPTTQPKP